MENRGHSLPKVESELSGAFRAWLRATTSFLVSATRATFGGLLVLDQPVVEEGKQGVGARGYQGRRL